MLHKAVRQWWFWVAMMFAAAVVLLAAFFRKLVGWPAPIVAVHKQPGEHLVVLFGDSITQGGGSYNYVELLVQRLGGAGYRFMNAGIGGDTAYNLLNRLEAVVESQPDALVILVGTNEMQAYLRGGDLPAIMQRFKKLPQAVTLEWYLDNVRQIIQAVQHTTPARVALCSIPILGEDLDSRPNEAIRMFNRALKALADELQVTYLPVYETMEQVLRAHQHVPGQAFDEARAGELMLPAIWQHNIRGRSWDEVSARNNLVLMTDLIHFNSRGAAIIADLIAGWLHARVAEHP